MRTYQNRLRAVGVVTVAVALLSAPTVSMAQTDQQKPTAHVAKTYPKKHVSRQWRPYVNPNLYGSTQGRCAWPYQNQFPPCMSTFPQGSPNYHGSRPGVTFQDE
jgi:hypothetical protein